MARLQGNSAPSLALVDIPLTTIDEDQSLNVGDSVALLVAALTSGGSLSDSDGDTLGVAIVGADENNGQWEYSVNSGQTWASLSGVSDSAGRLLNASASTRVRFIPKPNFNTTVPVPSPVVLRR